MLSVTAFFAEYRIFEVSIFFLFFFFFFFFFLFLFFLLLLWARGVMQSNERIVAKDISFYDLQLLEMKLTKRIKQIFTETIQSVKLAWSLGFDLSSGSV